MSQQLASLSVRQPPNATSRVCFNCEQPGHIARSCRSLVMSKVECFLTVVGKATLLGIVDGRETVKGVFTFPEQVPVDRLQCSY